MNPVDDGHIDDDPENAIYEPVLATGRVPNDFTNGAVTNVGVYGFRRFLPGITQVACRCGEKDSEIAALRREQANAVSVLREEHAATVSLLTRDFLDKLQQQVALHGKEMGALQAQIEVDLTERLAASFAYLDSARELQTDEMEHRFQETLGSLAKEAKQMQDQEAHVRASTLVLRKEASEKRAQLLAESERIAKIQCVVSLVNDYERDCVVLGQQNLRRQQLDFQRRQQKMLDDAQDEARAIIQTAQGRASRIEAEAMQEKDAILTAAHNEAAGYFLDSHRHSPTLSDASTSAISLRSFESLPILEEESSLLPSDHMAHGLARRASFDESQDSSRLGIRRKPIPLFSASDERSTSREGFESEAFTGRQPRRRKKSLPHLSPLEALFQEQTRPARKRTVSRGKIVGTHDTVKSFKPY